MTATLDTVRAARSLRHRRRARGLAVMAGLILAGLALTLSLGQSLTPPGDVLRVLMGQDVPGASFTGTWALTQGAGISWYMIFNSDGTWLISDTADGSARRVFGTYTVKGNVATGPMTNPGIGEGEIVATIDGDVLSLDFIEHWHNPYKHVPYTGTKI